MVKPDKPPANGFVLAARKVYNPIGFSKGYNFVLWFVFAGALMGFILARFPYLNFNGIFCSQSLSATMHASPGECFYYLMPNHEKVGIILHLAGILPAGFLVCFQFVPVIRHRIILFHRINGYIILLLAIVGTVGALMIARNAFGGGIDTQTAVGLLAIVFLGSLLLAYINIKCLQIEQHRKWMLRAWFYAGSIITTRIILFTGATIISGMPGYYTARPCAQIYSTLSSSTNFTINLYPECAPFLSGENPDQYAVVKADTNSPDPNQVAAALGINFGSALWLALALHAIGIEIYLHLTPAEHKRLRDVSYQRQLEAGMKKPGRAGLTADRLGDAEEFSPTMPTSGASEPNPPEEGPKLSWGTGDRARD